jgi:hypothetical protein
MICGDFGEREATPPPSGVHPRGGPWSGHIARPKFSLAGIPLFEEAGSDSPPRTCQCPQPFMSLLLPPHCGRCSGWGFFALLALSVVHSGKFNFSYFINSGARIMKRFKGLQHCLVR